MSHLKDETELYLEKLAYAIRREYNYTDIVFDFQKFTDAIPCEVITYNSWEIGNRPAAIKIGDSCFQIKINPSESLLAKLTLICNVFLHMGFRTNPDLWNKQPVNTPISFLKDNQFWQASYMALALLMPRTEFETIMNQSAIQSDKINITPIAAYFHVPYSLVQCRAERMHFIRTWC